MSRTIPLSRPNADLRAVVFGIIVSGLVTACGAAPSAGSPRANVATSAATVSSAVR